MIKAGMFPKLAFFLTFAFMTVSARAEIVMEREARLKKNAEVSSQTVCLSDLVEEGWIQSRCSVDRKACCRWDLGGGLSRTFKRAAIQAEVSQMNLGGFSITLRGDEVTVTQTYRELTVKEIEAKILAQLTSKARDEFQSELKVNSLRVPMPIYVALKEESSWEVQAPEQLSKKTSFKIVSSTDTTNVYGWAHAELSLKREVFVAKKTIRPMEKVTREDFDLKMADILDGSEKAVTFRKEEFPEGVRTKQTIMAGMPLVVGAIERLPLVQLGDTVTLILRSDNLRVSTKGVVQGSAAEGDMVTVQLSRYGRTFRGRLMQGRLVEVWL